MGGLEGMRRGFFEGGTSEVRWRVDRELYVVIVVADVVVELTRAA